MRLKNFFVRKVRSLLGTSKVNKVSTNLERLDSVASNLLILEFLKKNLFETSRYLNTKRITHFHRSVFTQNGEDGVIREIFRRIGETNKYFVEFGVHGVKNNSTFLLIEGWKGLWITGEKRDSVKLQANFGDVIRSGQLSIHHDWVTPENIEAILLNRDVFKEFDFLSIDIDGNDYWVWKSISRFSPRVVCIEYNSTFPPETKWVMKYNADHRWDQSTYFGASLKSLELLGRNKGYHLVGCDFSGCNAFFVRNDLCSDLFEEPFTAENHYEPPRYFIKGFSGHQPGFGTFETR